MNALDTAMMTGLTGDSGADGVATLATGGIYQLDAPQKTNPPYVIYQEASDFPVYACGNNLVADRMFYMIRGFAVDANETGPMIVGKIADRLKALFTNATLSVSGKTLLSCRFDRSYPPTKEFDQANNKWLYSRGILCEVWLS